MAPPERTGFGTTLLNSAISGGDGTPRILLTPQQCCDAELYAFYVKLALKYGDEIHRDGNDGW